MRPHDVLAWLHGRTGNVIGLLHFADHCFDYASLAIKVFQRLGDDNAEGWVLGRHGVAGDVGGDEVVARMYGADYFDRFSAKNDWFAVDIGHGLNQ